VPSPPSLVSRKPGAQPSSSVAFLCGISVASLPAFDGGYPARRRSGGSGERTIADSLSVIVIVSPTGAMGVEVHGHVQVARDGCPSCAQARTSTRGRSPRRGHRTAVLGCEITRGSPASRRRRLDVHDDVDRLLPGLRDIGGREEALMRIRGGLRSTATPGVWRRGSSAYGAPAGAAGVSGAADVVGARVCWARFVPRLSAWLCAGAAEWREQG